MLLSVPYLPVVTAAHDDGEVGQVRVYTQILPEALWKSTASGLAP